LTRYSHLNKKILTKMFFCLVRQRTEACFNFVYRGSHSDSSTREKNMKLTTTRNATLLISAALIAGCASNNPYQSSTPYSTPYSSSSSSSVQPRNNDIGVIESINLNRSGTNNPSSGAGAVIGGVVGGLLGNQIGGGTGKTVATVAGVVGGAVVGNNVEKNRNSASPDIYEIRVRMNNGNSTNLLQDNIGNLHVGDRVRVVDGRVYLY
jgi:outer membrane lipoprotein SlyB